MTPYEGNKPYIFVSYAHKDSNRVLPIIETLAACGFRVWFDQGIEVGTQWSEYIAEHLEKANCIMAFLSKASLASHNCYQEISYALDLNRNILAVHLEKIELTGGLRMRLGPTQAIFRYQHEYDDSFYGELLRAGILKPCLETSEPTAATPTPTPMTDDTLAPKKKAVATDDPTAKNIASLDGLSKNLTKKKPEPAAITMKTNEFTIENGELMRCHSQSANITVPEGVHTIGSEAFKDHTNLRKVTLPDTVTLIRGWAFAGCTNLEEITLPEGIELITSHSFKASGLKHITIPDGVRAIGREAFKDCAQLETVTFPKGLTEIDPEAFRGCHALKEIALPASVRTVGEYAFSGCTKLKHVSLSSKTVYSAETKKSFPAGAKLFYTDGEPTPAAQPKPQPAKPTKTVKTAKTVEKHRFTVTNGVLTAYEGTGGAIVIPENVKVIGERVFLGNDTLTGITIPEGVVEIGEGAFRLCRNLTAITLPKSLVTIGKQAFSDCANLKTVTLSPHTKYARIFSPSFPKHTKLIIQ